MLVRKITIEESYYYKFKELPRLLDMTSFEHPKYIRLMKAAIKRGTPLLIEETWEEFNKDNEMINLYEDKEAMFLLESYRCKFNKLPPYDKHLKYYDPIYKKIIQKALSKGEMINKQKLYRYHPVDNGNGEMWKDFYNNIVKDLSRSPCFLSEEDFYFLPKSLLRKDVLIIDEEAKKNGKFFLRLNETKAKNMHYRVFCKFFGGETIRIRRTSVPPKCV